MTLRVIFELYFEDLLEEIEEHVNHAILFINILLFTIVIYDMSINLLT